MPKKKIGRQTPTFSVILPYRKSIGAEAVSLYESTGRKARKWQGFAAKAARGLDIAGIHGVNPRSGSASAVVGTNNFDSAVSQSVTSTANADNDVESAVALVQGNDLDISGMAMAPAFRSALAALTKQDGSKLYPELGWGKTPGTINGLPVDSNSTVSFGSSKDLAVVGNFEDYFRWGYAKDISIEVIRYGNPDNDANKGDLAGHNQVYLRGECYIGWGILLPSAFAKIVAP